MKEHCSALPSVVHHEFLISLKLAALERRSVISSEAIFVSMDGLQLIKTFV